MILRPALRPPLRDPMRAATALKEGVGASYPSALFALSETGIDLRPSLATCFQDNFGVTPVTAPGQTVGLMLDQSRGLVRGPNLITNGDFATDIAGWSASRGSTLSWNSGRLRITNGGTSTSGTADQAVTLEVGEFYEIYVSATDPAANLARLRIGSAAGLTGTPVYNIDDILTGTTRRVIFRAETATTYITVGVRGGTLSVTYIEYDDISLRKLSGYHAVQSDSAKRPKLMLDSGGHYYLKPDGVNDFMSIPALNLATDKVSLFCGVRKLNDTAEGVIAELSADPTANNGVFSLTASAGAAAQYDFVSKGTSAATAVASPFAAPHTGAITGLGDISGDGCAIRVARSEVDADATDQGSGNYGNYALYLFSRGGTSLFSDEEFYGLTVVGREATAAEITGMESLYTSAITPFITELPAVTSIVAVGDSITEGSAASTEAQRWLNIVSTAINSGTLVNSGIGGTVLQNSADSGGSARVNNLRDRYVADMTGANKKDMAIIGYGFNDARYIAAPATFNVAAYKADFREIITGLLSAGYTDDRILIVGPYYITDAGLGTGSTGFTGQTRAAFLEHVTAAREVAQEFHTYFHDSYAWMLENGSSSLISVDNIHPNDTGHAEIADGVLTQTVKF